MIQKVKSLVGQIDCPHCFSLLQWNNKEDVHVSNGNKYVICPECGEHIILDKFRDYWIDPTAKEDDDGDGDSSNSNKTIFMLLDGNSITIMQNGSTSDDYSALNFSLQHPFEVYERNYLLNIFETTLYPSDIMVSPSNSSGYVLELTFSTFRSETSTMGLKTEYVVTCTYNSEGEATNLSSVTRVYKIALDNGK